MRSRCASAALDNDCSGIPFPAPASGIGCTSDGFSWQRPQRQRQRRELDDKSLKRKLEKNRYVLKAF